MAKQKIVRQNGIVFQINKDNTATVVQHSGRQACAIVVPESVQGYTVTGIDSGVFHKCVNISALRIPTTVTYIGWSALPPYRKVEEKVCVGEEVRYDYFQGCIKHEYWEPVYEFVTKKIPIVQITKGSYAERYCKENNILYTLVG